MINPYLAFTPIASDIGTTGFEKPKKPEEKKGVQVTNKELNAPAAPAEPAPAQPEAYNYRLPVLTAEEKAKKDKEALASVDPDAGIKYTPEEVEAAKMNQAKLDLGIQAYRSPSAKLPEVEKKVVEAVAAFTEENAKKTADSLAGVEVESESTLSPAEKERMARILWQTQLQNPATWRSLNYAQKAVMVEYQFDRNEAWNALRDKYAPDQNWTDLLLHGAASYAKSIEFAGVGVGGVKSMMKTMETQMDLTKVNAERRNGMFNNFFGYLKKFKENPEIRSKAKVEELYKLFLEKPELMTADGAVKDPAVVAKIKSLNEVEAMDLFIRLKHKKPSKKFGKDAPPVTLDDFDLDQIPDNYDYRESMDNALTYRIGSGAATAMGDIPPIEFANSLEGKAQRRIEERRAKVKNGFIDPVLFAEENVGNGVFGGVETDQFRVADAHMASAYGYTFRKIEGGLAGAASLAYQVFGAGEDPTGFFNQIKRSIRFGSGSSDVKNLIAWYDSYLNTQEQMQAFASGGKSVIGARIGALLSDHTVEEVQAAMLKNGYLNDEAINVGMMRVMPSAIVGRASVFNGAAMRGGMGVVGGASRVAFTAKNLGLISVDNFRRLNIGLYKFGSRVEKFEAATFGLPTKVIGAVAIGTGKTAVYAVGGTAQAIVNAANKGLSKIAPELAGSAEGAVVKKVLSAVGVTSAFYSFDLTRQLAGLYGMGKAAEAAGGLLYKYGYRGPNLNGRTFQGALAEASKDMEMNVVARSLAKVGNVWGGLPASMTYDFAKGAWHGGGVGYALGYIQDGHRGGVNGFWGGAGMGGAGATHATVQMYRSGIFTHSIAENELKAMIKDTPNKAAYEDLIKRANDDQDWTLLPMAVGAMKMANNNGIKVLLFNESQSPDIPIDLLREDLILDTDYTVNVRDAAGATQSRTFLVPKMKAAAEAARARAKQLAESAKTEAEFAQAEQASKDAERLEIDLHTEFNDWLSSVRQNGTAEQRARVRSGSTLFRGVHIDGEAGNGVIYVNTGKMANSTLAHEVFHGVQLAVYRAQAMSHFSNQVFGIRLLNGQVVAQDGVVTNLDMLKQFQQLYNDVLFSVDPTADAATKALYEQRKAEANARLDAAFDILSKDQSGLDATAIKEAHDTLRRAAEEFGANYFESFLQRNRSDYLFRQGKYSALRRVVNSVENYIDFQIRNDLNGDGISLQIQKTLDNRKSKEFETKILKIRAIQTTIAQLRAKIEKETVITGRNKDGSAIYHFKDPAKVDLYQRLIERKAADIDNIASSIGKSEIGDIFRDASGAHLVMPQIDRVIKKLIERTEANAKQNNALDLSTLSGPELSATLRKAGLTHFLDENGRLKTQQRINQEAVERGKKALAVIQTLGPLSGMVIHTDAATGTTRATGVLTQEGIDALVAADAILPNEAKNAMALLEGIKSAMGMSTLGGTEYNFLYYALSHESYAADGTVVKDRRPKNIVDPTFRKVVPYRLELVMTSTGADGSKVEPHFEMMVTALDLEVLMRRGADTFNGSYTLPSGKVIRAADLFGGSFDIFKHHLQRYLQSMSERNAPAGADLFGGGEIGAAIRDLMYQTVGAIKGTTGKDPLGNPLLVNNPIISPLRETQRGPDFVFTTFRVDLMSDLSVGSQRWMFNERYAYPRVANNYSPVAFGDPATLKSGLTEIRATHEFEGKKNSETGEVEQISVNYRIYQKADRRFYVTANNEEVGVSKKISFGTAEEAKRFVNILGQRHMLAAKNVLSQAILGGDSGILVANIGGNLVLVDSNKNYQIVQEGRIYPTESQAVLAAITLHNEQALAKLEKSKNKQSAKIIRSFYEEMPLINPRQPELLPPRLALNKDGSAKLETVKKGGKAVVYSESDPEVIAGLVKAGTIKKKMAFQKVGYNLMNTVFGDQNLRIDSPVVKRGAEQASNIMIDEALEAIKDPEVRRALGWYRHMVKSGYSIYGSLYGLFTESLGSTSPRTDVEQNFIQAEEAVALLSQGVYDKQLQKIHAELTALQRRITTKDSNGVSQFENDAVRLVLAKKALGKVISEFGFGKDDYDIFDFIERNTESGLDASHFAFFDKAIAEASARRKKERLNQTEINEAVRLAQSKIFRSKENLMMRSNGKKYNANTVKVGQVMYGLWRELSDGPKAVNFARNLEGTSREATVDVWAARTIHRIINSKILKRQHWRLSAGVETGVDYVWQDHGTTENPNVQVGGDFGFAQEIFRQASEGLKKRDSKNFGDLTPDDLQALMWFAEKRLWANKGWTEGAGAEMSSFEGPLNRFSGVVDANGIEGWGNIRRFIAGFTGNYGPESLRIVVNGEPIDASGAARSTAQPSKVLELVKSVGRAALGESNRGMNVNQTHGLYGGFVEHSVSFDAIARRGNLTVLENALAKATSKHDRAKAKMDLKAKEAAMADPANKKAAESALKSATTSYNKAKAEMDAATSKFNGEKANGTVRNQMGMLVDGFIELAKNYLQKDVMVGEVVGSDHPNARPAVDIMFEKPMTLDEVNQLVKAITGSSNGIVTGFTAIPDPRSPHTERITALTRMMQKMKGADGKVPEKSKYLYNKYEAEINKLVRYKGIQAQANPEMTFRYREYNDNKDISTNAYDLMTEAGARRYMADWQSVFTNAKPNFEIYNGNRLTFNEYHVSTETINSGGYDTFNPADVGTGSTLGHRLARYERDLNRELASFEEQSRGQVGSADSPAYTPDRTAWRSTGRDKAPVDGGENGVSDDASAQTGGDKAGSRVKTPEEADAWIKRTFEKPFTRPNAETGIGWGDREYTIFQKRNADGSMSQEFRVMGVNDRKPTVVIGKEAAMAEVKARLTGEKLGAGGEREITVNGVKFNVTEGMRPVVSPDGVLRMEYGAFSKKDDIWSFSPADKNEPTTVHHDYATLSDPSMVADLLQKGGNPTFYVLSDRARKFLAHLNYAIATNNDGVTTPRIVKINNQINFGNTHRTNHVSDPALGLYHVFSSIDPTLSLYERSDWQSPVAGSHILTFGHQSAQISQHLPVRTLPNGGKAYAKDLTDLNGFIDWQNRTFNVGNRQLVVRTGPETLSARESISPDLAGVEVEGGRKVNIPDNRLAPRLNDNGQVIGINGDAVDIGSANVLNGTNFYFSKGHWDSMLADVQQLADFNNATKGDPAFQAAVDALIAHLNDYVRSTPDGRIDYTETVNTHDRAARNFATAWARYTATVQTPSIKTTDVYQRLTKKLNAISGGSPKLLNALTQMGIRPTMDSMFAMTEALRGGGSALNGENAAIFHAMGIGTPDTTGVKSFIVNKTGAVYKTRRNVYGEGNTLFEYQATEKSDMATRSHFNTDVAIRETVRDRESGNVTSFITKGKAYSPVNKHIGLERAFNSEPDTYGFSVANTKNGGLFSKRAQGVLPPEIEIHTKMDSAGNITVRAIDSNNHNWVKGKDGRREQESGIIMDFKLMVGRKFGKEGTVTDGRSVPPTGEVTITGMWRPRKDPTRNSWNDDVSQPVMDSEGNVIGEMDEFQMYFDKRLQKPMTPEPRAADPKIESAVIAEVVERLRQSGIKSIGEDTFDATGMYDQIVQAMHGKEPNKWKKGWESDEPYWKIDPKTTYSPESQQKYDALPEHLKAMSDEYMQILSKYGLTRRSLTTKTRANVRQDLLDAEIATSGLAGQGAKEVWERGTDREVLNISVEDRARLSEIVLQFAKARGYFTDLKHASRSSKIEGPMKGSYSDFGVALHAGITGERYQISGFGQYRYPFKARGEFFDINNDRHVDRLEAVIEKMIKEGTWLRPNGGRMPSIYKVDSLAGVMANLKGGGGQFDKFERVGRYTNFKQAIEAAGFTGYKESESALHGDPLPHVAITESRNAKLADPVTFGSDGKVIPIHERFDVTNEDPRYSPDDQIAPEQLLAYKTAGAEYHKNSIGGSMGFKYKMLPPDLKAMADEYAGITKGERWKDHLSPEWNRLGQIVEAFAARAGYTQKGEEMSVNPDVQGESASKINYNVTYDADGNLIPVFLRFNRINKNPNFSPDEPSYVDVNRVFDETGVSTDTLYSKKARSLLGDYTIDFSMIKDQELREGMEDAPMGANKNTKNPLAIVSLNSKTGKKDTVAEFYLMPVIEKDRGMTYGHAVLQMNRKKGNITVDTLVGVLSEMTERLRMTGVRQIIVPRKAWSEMAFSKRELLEKLRQKAKDAGVEDEVNMPDPATVVDEHDALKIILGEFSDYRTGGGPTLMYHIDRKKQYSPDVRMSQIDLRRFMPSDRAASPVTDPNVNPEGFLYHVTIASLDQIKRRGLRSNAFYNAYDPETGEYLDSDGVEDPLRQVIWFAASEGESNDNVRGGHTYQLRIKESKLAEFADLTDAEREGSGAGLIAEGGRKPWAIRPEFLEYRIIDSKKYEGVGEWLPVAGPPSKKKGQDRGK